MLTYAKAIPGYEDYYRIDRFGNIFSNKYGNWRQLRPWISTTGYKVIQLYKDNKLHKYKIHRLLYSTFIGVIPIGYQVDHINRNREDNTLKNLRVVTSAQNSANRSLVKGKKFKGITLHKSGKWRSKAFYKNKIINLGYYNTQIQAAIVHDLKMIELHGIYTNTNLIKVADNLLC